MRDAIISRLKQYGKLVGRTTAGTVYTIRPATNLAVDTLEVFRGSRLMDVRSLTSLSLWAARVGLEVL